MRRASKAPMPRILSALRHGESEGQVAARLAKVGDHSAFTERYRTTPSSKWGVTKLGFAQAYQAGVWLDRFTLGTRVMSEREFDKGYISPHRRSRQSLGAVMLHAPVKGGRVKADARLDLRLREQDFGDISTMPPQEYLEKYPDNAQTRRVDKLYWRPPGGESVADVADRARLFLGALERAHRRGVNSVLICSHGRQISALQVVLEGIDPDLWADYLVYNEIKNTTLVQYSRINPKTGREAPAYHWTRIVTPWERPEDPGEWREFDAPSTMSIDDCLRDIPQEWLADPLTGLRDLPAE